jgi:hypothetical protein
MKTTWCWRCQIDYPMLEDNEWRVLMAAHAYVPNRRLAFAELERQASSLGLWAPLAVDPELPPVARYYWHLIAGFELFTQIVERSPAPIWHHRLAVFGPPCWACGRLLRTARAKMCGFCGRQRVVD